MKLINRSLGAVLFGVLASAGVCAQDEAQEAKKIIGSLQDVEGTVLIKRGEESIPVVEGQQVTAVGEVPPNTLKVIVDSIVRQP